MKTSELLQTILLLTLVLVLTTTPTNAPAQNSPEEQNFSDDTSPSRYEPPSSSLFLRLIGDKPYGTHISSRPHAALTYQIARPLPFQNTWLTGFSYAERGGALTEIFALTASAAASVLLQDPAPLEITGQLSGHRLLAPFGVLFEYLTPPSTDPFSKGPYHFTVKFNHAVSLTGSKPPALDRLPVILFWGLQLKLWSIPIDPQNPELFTRTSLGFPLDFAFPLTRWVQIDASFTASIGVPLIEVSTGATFHLGNRFFLSAGSSYTYHQFGPFLRAGVRL